MARFSAEGYRPRIMKEAAAKHTTLALVAIGLGVAIVPESAIRSAPRAVTFRPLSTPLPAVEHFTVWRCNDVSKRSQAFLDLLNVTR